MGTAAYHGSFVSSWFVDMPLSPFSRRTIFSAGGAGGVPSIPRFLLDFSSFPL
jgi:hypothetical protein